MEPIVIGSASIRLVLKNGKLVLDLNEQIGPIAAPQVEIDLNPADAIALVTGGFSHLFGKK